MCLWSNKGKPYHKTKREPRLMNRIVEGLGAIGSAPSGGSTKVTIKATLFDSFARK